MFSSTLKQEICQPHLNDTHIYIQSIITVIYTGVTKCQHFSTHLHVHNLKIVKTLLMSDHIISPTVINLCI